MENCRKSSFTDFPLFTHSEKLIVVKLHIKTTSHFPLKCRRDQNIKPAKICMTGLVFTHLPNNNLTCPPPWPLPKPLKIRNPQVSCTGTKIWQCESERLILPFPSTSAQMCWILKLQNCSCVSVCTRQSTCENKVLAIPLNIVKACITWPWIHYFSSYIFRHRDNMW